MSSRLEDTSAILGEYMLKGWTLTDLHCEDCKATPLMREPAGAAAAAGRSPIQFCALCDGRPEGRIPSASTSSTSIYATPPTTDSNPQPSATSSSVSSAPNRATATIRGDPDAAADAIGGLLLKGYSLLQDTCPQSTCRGIPLVGYPRKKDGTRDTRRECVSCGGRWVDEKDLKNAGMVEDKLKPKPVATSSSTSTAMASAATPSSTSTATGYPTWTPSAHQPPTGEEPESPRSKARRELYDFGNEINAEVERIRANVAKGKEKEQDPESSAYSVPTGTSTGKMETSTDKTETSTDKTETSTDKTETSTGKTETSRAKSQSSSTRAVVATTATAATTASTSRTTSDRPVFVAEEHRPATPDGKLRVVLISTGSVASVKIPNIVSALRDDGNVDVQVVSTDASLHFFDRDQLEAQHPGVRVWTDTDEWSDWKKIGDPILHIELRRWADLVVIAPVSADMLAKIAGGICDNLPLSLLRALSPDTPVILCPAMNTFMYSHPLTARHLAFVRQVLHYYILGPQGGGKLACGDVGAGKMTEWTDIVQAILGYAAVFRNKPDGDRSMLDALLTGGVPPNQGSFVDIEPVVVQTPAAPALPRQVPTINIQAPTEREVIHVKHTPQRRATRISLRALVTSIPANLLSYLLLPLLALLHLLFTISSIVLRVVQSRPEPLPELTKPAPPHLGLILVPGKGPRKVVAERFIESVRRAVVWAGEWGVETISVWDGQGLGVQHHGAVTSSLLDLPPSPPSSTPPSPPLSSIDEPNDEPGTLGDETITKSVYVSTPSGPRRVEVHFLPPSASDAIARVTQQYISEGIAPGSITEKDLGAAVFATIGIPSDPDLLVIHHLSPPGFWRGLLPRPAPELWGYPAWALRITEIYTHPPPLPFYIPFIGKLLHNSPLPILRKLGASFPDEIDVGVLDTDAWDGAQSSWEKVEQRRGK